MTSSKVRGPGQNKRFWTEEEDKALIESLLELHDEGKYKAEGNFKAGHLKALEIKLHNKIPGCDLEAHPDIGSRLKTLKSYFQVVHEMLTGPNCSGFGWDSEKQIVTEEKPAWDAYLQVLFILNFLWSLLHGIVLVTLLKKKKKPRVTRMQPHFDTSLFHIIMLYP